MIVIALLLLLLLVLIIVLLEVIDRARQVHQRLVQVVWRARIWRSEMPGRRLAKRDDIWLGGRRNLAPDEFNRILLLRLRSFCFLTFALFWITTFL